METDRNLFPNLSTEVERLAADQKMKSNKEIVVKNRAKQQRAWKIQNNDRVTNNNNNNNNNNVSIP